MQSSANYSARQTMEHEKIERYVEDLLTVSGISKDGGEQRTWLLLHHLYSAVAMYELMSDAEKALIAGMQKKLRYFFSSKCELKERRINQRKESFPPTPLLKEKENKEEDEKTLSLVEHGFSADDDGVDNADSASSGKRLKGHSHLSATLSQRREADNQRREQEAEESRKVKDIVDEEGPPY